MYITRLINRLPKKRQDGVRLGGYDRDKVEMKYECVVVWKGRRRGRKQDEGSKVKQKLRMQKGRSTRLTKKDGERDDHI